MRDSLRPLLSVALLLGTIIPLAAVPADARVVVVRHDGLGDFDDILAAIEVVAAGDTIDIGPGDWRLNVVLEKGITFRAQEGPGTATLDGGRAGRILQLEVPSGGAGSTAYRFEGLILQNGVRDVATAAGGAVFCRGDGDFTFFQCTFGDNSSWDGGALHARLGARVIVEDSHFKGNRALRVGGAATIILGAEATFVGCEFSDNRADVFAGGIATDQATIEVEGCSFYGNRGLQGTGVINLNATDAHVSSSTFALNRSGSRATIVAEIHSTLELEHSILAHDTGAYGVLSTSTSQLVRECNLYWENALGSSPSGPEDTGLELDPYFCDVEGGDLSLSANSPALVGTEACPLPRGAFGPGCDAVRYPFEIRGEQGFRLLPDGRIRPELRLGLRALADQPQVVAAAQLEVAWAIEAFAVTSLDIVARGDWLDASEISDGSLSVAMASTAPLEVGGEFEPLVALVLDQAAVPESGSLLSVTFSELRDPAREELEHWVVPIRVEPSCNPGDPDLDGDADLADALLALDLLAGSIKPSDPQACSADVTGDPGLDIADVVGILRLALGLPPARSGASGTSPRLALDLVEGRPALRVEGGSGLDLQLDFWPERPASLALAGHGGLARLIESGETGYRVLWAQGDHSAAQLDLIVPASWPGGEIRVASARSVDATGNLASPEMDRSSVVVGDGPPRPLDLTLQVQPNPFNPRTRFLLQLPAGTPELELVLHDASGRQVRRWDYSQLPAGLFEVNWDGLDGSGQAVSSGVYYIRANAGAERATARAVLVR